MTINQTSAECREWVNNFIDTYYGMQVKIFSNAAYGLAEINDYMP